MKEQLMIKEETNEENYQDEFGAECENGDNSISHVAKMFTGFKDADDKELKKIFKPVLKTGFERLDEMLGGGLTPGWAVLGAVSNLGKSTFALQIASNVAKSGTPVLFFSLEMPKEWIAAKLISQQSFLMSGKNEKKAVMAKELLNKKKFESSRAKWKVIKDAAQKVTDELGELYIIDAKDADYVDKHFSAETIRGYIKTFMDTTGKVPLVIIDYLQIIPMAKENEASADKFSIDHNIDVLSKINKDITVLLISSVNRASYNSSKPLEPIRLDSFKGSGTIEYSSDIVLGMDFVLPPDGSDALNASKRIMKEKSRNPRNIQVMALKQRYNASGGDAVVYFNYFPAYDCFVEVDKPKDDNGDNAAGKETQSKSQEKTNKNTDYFANCKTKKEVKQHWKELMKKYHSDQPEGNDEISKEITRQRDEALDRLDK